MSKDTMKTDLEQLSSEELLNMWNTNDQGKYKREAFPVIKEILTERGIDVPQQSSFSFRKGDQRQLVNCAACGKEIGDSAKICIHCGTDQRNFFMRHKIITFFLVMFVIGTINRATGTTSTAPTTAPSTSDVASAAPTPAPPPIPAPKPEVVKPDPIKVTAGDLLKVYEANEVKADLIYKGKMVDVTGIVDSISVTFGQTTVALSAGDGSSMKNVICYFDDKTEDIKVADLKKGDQVTMSGVVSGDLIFSVGVDHSIVKQIFQR